MPGWKFSEYEMKGVPLRLEVGPRDLENNQCVVVRRDTGEKMTLPLDGIETTIQKLLDEIHGAMYAKAQQSLASRIYDADSWTSFVDQVRERPGFIRAMWCGDEACEQKIKDETGATSRCMPFVDVQHEGTCIACGRAADKLVVWGKAY
jgi:prolyl-tRNA synthetase